MLLAPPAPTQSASLFLAGHMLALSERGEVAQGNPMPTFGRVQVDAVLSEVTAVDQAMSGGVYHKGDFRAVVAKGAFDKPPKQGDPCSARGENWKVKNPVIEKSATYQLAISRSLR